ncbi:MAG: GNAT family N-acetyltransferase, partial [Pseudomonadota bacterium]
MGKRAYFKGEVRRAGPADSALIGRPAADVFDAVPAEPFRSVLLADPSHILVVAIVDGVVVGQCQAVIVRHLFKAPELFVENLGVAPPFQRQGAGSALVGEMLTEARKIGCEEIYVLAEPENQAACGFYAAAGFQRNDIVVFDRPVSRD